MIEKREQATIKVESSPDKAEAQGNDKLAEESHETEKKPLEKMTKSELIQEIKILDEDSKKQHDLYLRSQAEIENIKKRNAKEKQDWVKYANETLIKEILPVLDNMEKAISHSQNENSLDALREGVELTLKGLKDTLKKLGLEEVKAKGEPFDPCFHEAVSEVADEHMEPGMILHELQKGYVLNHRLIRPSMVVLSKGKDTKATENDHTPERACEEK
ncbi:MAG: nucleotide exchange factor GrpE [Desulfobacteraceae bacterium]|jgi:molecular chaperone GrpE